MHTGVCGLWAGTHVLYTPRWQPPHTTPFSVSERSLAVNQLRLTDPEMEGGSDFCTVQCTGFPL